MNTIYTTGYAGRWPTDLMHIAVELDAVIVDIRHIPRSRTAGWNRDELIHRMGERYRHVPELGNVNVKTEKAIELADAALGMAKLLASARKRPLILLCACREYSSCHRRVVSDLLRECYHVETQEIVWPVAPSPPGLHKALSLWQPWAWLCVATTNGVAEKQHETRSWATAYRGPLLIHAAKKWDAENADMLEEEEFAAALRRHFAAPAPVSELGFGAVIGRVELVDCIPTGKWCESLSEKERAFGDFSHGRFAWRFTNPERFLSPIPARGYQQIFNCEIDLNVPPSGIDIQHRHEPEPPQEQMNLF